MKNIYRIFFALWFLIGWMIHVYLGIWSPDTYQGFNSTVIFSPVQKLWVNVIIPNITIFALLLAIVEVTIGALMISKGKWVKVGVFLSLIFNMCLVLVGLGIPADSGVNDFVRNRLPSLVFAALQIPLLWMQFERSVPEIFREKFQKIRKN